MDISFYCFLWRLISVRRVRASNGRQNRFLYRSHRNGQSRKNIVFMRLCGVSGIHFLRRGEQIILLFFIYAFMFGAVGSVASKLEDINTSSMPITLVFIIAFIVVMMSMSSGDVDSLLMKICSYVPFTSPMAMFTRIAMSTVPAYEIIISVAILMASTVGIGVIAAKIYRLGVLLYGTTPKIGSVLKSVMKA